MFARRIVWPVLLVVAVVLLWFGLRRPPAPARLEVLQSELVMVDGRWHQPDGPTGTNQPFTGALLLRYPDGTLQSRSEVEDGWLHGLSEGWHTNGQLQVQEHFQRGISHGPRTKWYPNGNKLSEGTILDGEFTGVFRRWHENGVLAEEVEMQKGREHGIAVSYYPSEYVKARASLDHGQLLSVQRWEDGQMKEPPAN